MSQADPGARGPTDGPTEELEVQVSIPQRYPADSVHWLNHPKYRWFRDGWHYATTQTHAIPALAKCSPRELYWVVWAVMRGAKISDPEEPLRPGPAAGPAPEDEQNTIEHLALDLQCDLEDELKDPLAPQTWERLRNAVRRLLRYRLGAVVRGRPDPVPGEPSEERLKGLLDAVRIIDEYGDGDQSRAISAREFEAKYGDCDSATEAICNYVAALRAGHPAGEAPEPSEDAIEAFREECMRRGVGTREDARACLQAAYAEQFGRSASNTGGSHE